MARLPVPTAGTTSHSLKLRFGRLTVISVAVGLMSFLITEFMHYLLIPDLGRRWERWFAEGVSAALVASLTGKLIQTENKRREAALLRMQVISEMNHHIRNALAAISLSTDSIQNQENQACMKVIAESVDHIEWALREVLLRPMPISEREANGLRYFRGHRHRDASMQQRPHP